MRYRMRGRNGGVSRLVLTIVIAIILLMGVAAMFQDRLIDFPDHPPLETAIADARSRGLAPWPGEDDYRGLLREPAGRPAARWYCFTGMPGMQDTATGMPQDCPPRPTRYPG